jgi:hypothetical protein
MANELNLDGAEITVIKALGLTGGEISGEELMTRVPGMNPYDLIDVLKGLIMVGYVEADKRSFYNAEELKDVHFSVNSGYQRDLREALDPRASQPKSKRVRRE